MDYYATFTTNKLDLSQLTWRGFHNELTAESKIQGRDYTISSMSTECKERAHHRCDQILLWAWGVAEGHRSPGWEHWDGTGWGTGEQKKEATDLIIMLINVWKIAQICIYAKKLDYEMFSFFRSSVMIGIFYGKYTIFPNQRQKATSLSPLLPKFKHKTPSVLEFHSITNSLEGSGEGGKNGQEGRPKSERPARLV